MRINMKIININKLKKWFRNLFCCHNIMVKFYPSDVVRWNTKSGKKNKPAKHKTIVIEGCLNCHKLWIRDFVE